MEAITLLLLTAVVIAAFLFLFPRDPKKVRLINLAKKMPGPPSYPIVGTTLPFIFLPRHRRLDFVQDRIKIYKPILRTWIGSRLVVQIWQPEHAEILLGSMKNLDKSFTYKFLYPWLGTGLLTSSGEKWHTHRKMITPTFHFKILEDYLEVFADKSKILISKLQKEVGSSGFDIYPYITRCALDIICESTMGTPVNAQEDLDSTYVSAVYGVTEITVHRLVHPWLHPECLFRLSSHGRRYNKYIRLLHDFTNKVIKERKLYHVTRNYETEERSATEDDIGKKKLVAFLDMLLDASESETVVTDEELREEVDTFMFEGHDTTSAGMCWALYLLGLHPDVQEKAYQEQENIFQGSHRSVTMRDLSEMKYLERVIKETIRLYPSVPGVGRTLTEDVQLGEFTLPEGCTVHINIYSIHRNPVQFPDPEKFDPDNFLPERVAKRHPYAYIPFSAGPRNCIGQKFAMLEMKTVLSYLLRHYRVRSLDRREDIKLLAELVLRPEYGIRVTIARRVAGTT